MTLQKEKGGIIQRKKSILLHTNAYIGPINIMITIRYPSVPSNKYITKQM